MVVTKTPMITVYKQDKFSTAEEGGLHSLKRVNKDFCMDNYHKTDWRVCKQITQKFLSLQMKGNMKIELIIKVLLSQHLRTKVLNCF